MNLTNNKSIQIEIVKILRRIGSKKCLEKAEILESESPSTSTLNFRNLDLSSPNIKLIVSCLRQEGKHNKHPIKSISFSYNHLLGDSGAIALVENLPSSTSEIGLVDCGISDIGGIEILNWMRTSSNLRMICMEGNNFSKKLKLEFKKFSTANAQVLVVY